MLGGIAVAVNAWLPPTAFVHCITITEPKVVLVDEERQALLGPRVAELRQHGCCAVFSVRTQKVVQGVTRLEDALRQHKTQEVRAAEIGPEVRSARRSLTHRPDKLNFLAPRSGPRHDLLHFRHHLAAKGCHLDATTILDEPVEHGDWTCPGPSPQGREHPCSRPERAAAFRPPDDAALPRHGSVAPD